MQTAVPINKFCTAPHSVGLICNNQNKLASAGESAAIMGGSKLWSLRKKMKVKVVWEWQYSDQFKK